MPVIINSPFESKYGFKSTNFSVDSNGNITANSLSLAVDDDPVSNPPDFTINESGGNFSFLLVGLNPTITLSRSERYVFSLNLSTTGFSIYGQDQISLFNQGLSHSDGSSNANAQGKQSGRLSFLIPSDAPNILYYGNDSKTIFGQINIIDPTGAFSTTSINSVLDSTNSSSGALIVKGGAGIAKTLNVGGIVISPEIRTTQLETLSDLFVKFENEIIFLGGDSSVVGKITAAGSTLPINNTTINNTVIGGQTPAAATFTSAVVTSAITQVNNVTTKQYVDNTATALAIAFGL